ncbi:MAG: hypothetical protein NTX91_05570 [candidate division SR1 bacterium]|nr:hypothetical protein [candidate division SR1 bacterium]
MKLFFLKEHSLYKIFKTIEKVPDGRTINIYIDPEHSFFDNERWGNQIKELLAKKQINCFFVTKTEKARYFFASLGLPVLHQEKHKILQFFRVIYDFFFNIKKFHLQAYAKKNYIFYVVFSFEVLFVLLILYLLYSLILPSAQVQISPANQVENVIYNFRYYPATDTEYPKYSRYLSVPFVSQYVDYKYNLTVNVSNIKYIQQPAEGTVVLYNKIAQEYSFLPQTKFVTSDGRMFVSTKAFKIPAGTETNPGTSSVVLKAADYDEAGVLMGTRGNMTKGTKLFIRNMKTSFYMEQLYGQVVDGFSGGSLQSQGVITQKDIDILSGKLLEYIYSQKKNIIATNFKDPTQMVLSFVDLIHTQVQNVTVANKVGDRSPLLKGSITVRLTFLSIKKQDLITLINKYLSDRSTDKIKSLKIDQNSIGFFSTMKIETGGVLVIPTKAAVMQSYDFQRDINGILSDIKSRILGLTKDEARTIIISYPEIGGVKIVIRPPWYTTIAKLKSRIKIYVDGERIK